MQAYYPKEYPQVHWDALNVNYPVRVNPQKDLSSEVIARKWRTQPDVLPEVSRAHIHDIREHTRDYRSCNERRQTQTSLDYGYKSPEVNRFNKHTSCIENKYIYPPSRRLEDRPPACQAHGTTEMKASYKTPISDNRLITDKDQFKHPISLETNQLPVKQSWYKELEPIETTYEGYEKYLDPYLTTSKLYHRPFTAEQLNKSSNSKDVITYYTLSDIPWVWSTKPKHDDCFRRVKIPKCIYDKEKFKGDFREIRTHNRLQWVPGSFRTEAKDNYGCFELQGDLPIDKFEEEVRTKFQSAIAELNTNIHCKDSSIKCNYISENSLIGSKKPICSVFEQCVQKNKRLMRTCNETE